jgi:hypothetical protein
VGTIITQSYPEYESQGANLTLEVIYNAIRTTMTKLNMTKVRNLYVQMDNASVNKNWALFAGLSALVLLGKTILFIYFDL